MAVLPVQSTAPLPASNGAPVNTELDVGNQIGHDIGHGDDRDEIAPDVYRRRWLILGVLCTSLMIIVIGNTSLNVALPAMSESLGLTNSQQQWVVDAYSLVFAGMLFTAGTLG